MGGSDETAMARPPAAASPTRLLAACLLPEQRPEPWLVAHRCQIGIPEQPVAPEAIEWCQLAGLDHRVATVFVPARASGSARVCKPSRMVPA